MRLLLRILAFAIIAQSLVVAWNLQPWMAGDSPSYLLLAKNLGLGHYGELTAQGWEPDALRPPGYPVLLWLLIEILRLPIVAVVGMQIAAYLSSLFLLDRLLPNDKTRIIFRLLAAAYPFSVAYASNIMTESWVMLCFSVIAYLLVTYPSRRMSLAAVGGALGIAILFRTDVLLLPIAIAALLIFLDRKAGTGFRLAIARPLLMLAATAAVLAPYAFWNLANFGKFSPVPFAAAVGNSLYTASWQEELALDDFNQFYAGVVTPRLARSGYLDQVAELNRSIGAPLLTPPDNPVKYPTLETRIASNQVFGAAAIERIADNPKRYVRHVIRNGWLLWNTSNYGSNVPAIAKVGLMISSYFVFIFGVIGALAAVFRRAEWGESGPLLILLLYPFVIHLPAHLEARYTAASRPLLVMFAALGIAWLLTRVYPKQYIVKRA